MQKIKQLTGYHNPDYAVSFAEFGKPRKLPNCGGWILERQIPGYLYWDAMGCYPIFSCNHWPSLHMDLDELQKKLVSLALVVDPFGNYDIRYLQKLFDRVLPFKEHYVIDLECPIDDIVSRSHFRCARKALREVEVEVCPDPLQFLDEWIELYSFLIARHKITGIQAFSSSVLEKQLRVPGIVMFRASWHGATVGLNIWFIQGEVAYDHLVACTSFGYELGAGFALKWYQINYFSDKLRWLNLGGGAGLKCCDKDGLSRFKKGWSTGTQTAYFCGKIFDNEKYHEINLAKCVPATEYFPAYRLGEFY